MNKNEKKSQFIFNVPSLDEIKTLFKDNAISYLSLC